jgi:hypothetical protein
MGVIKLSGWTYCTTLNCEHGSNKTIRMIILYDTELFTVQCRTICSPWEFYYSHGHSSVSYNVFTLRVVLLPCSQLSVVQYVHPESFITPRFTVQCRTMCSPWEFYYSHVHNSVSYNMFILRVLLLPCSQFSVVQYVHPESFITPMFTVQCRTFISHQKCNQTE